MGTDNYVNQLITKIKKNIDNTATIVRDTPLTAMDRSSKQKINKETRALNDTPDQMDFIGIFGAFHPKAADTFFLNAHGTFFRIDHILGHKSAPDKYKKTEISPCIFSDHNTMKPEANHQKKFGKITNTWR